MFYRSPNLSSLATRFTEYVLRNFAFYEVVSTESAAFFLGGYGVKTSGQPYEPLSDIAEFSKLTGELEGSWKHRGNLLQARISPRAITYMGQTLVVGGTRDRNANTFGETR